MTNRDPFFGIGNENESFVQQSSLSSGDMFDELAGEQTQDPTKQIAPQSVSAPQKQLQIYIPPSDEEIRARLEWQKESERIALAKSLREAAQSNPDAVAEARKIAKKLGVSEKDALENADVLRKLYQQQTDESATLLASSPILRFRMSDPRFAQVAHDKLDELTNEESLWKQIKDANESAGLIEERGLLGSKIASNLGTPEDQIRLRQINERMRAVGPVEGFLPGATEIVSQVIRSLPYAAGGAAVGAGAASVIPGAGTAAGAVAGAITSGFAYSAMLEGGNAYADLVEEGVEDEIAGAAALGVGIVAGALEVFGGKIAAAPIKKLIAQKLTSKISAAVVDRTTGRALRELGKDYLKTMTGEVTTEAAQEITQILGEVYARDRMGWEQKSLDEQLDRVLEIMQKVATGMTLAGLPAPVIRFIGDQRRADKAQKTFETIENIVKASNDSTIKARDGEAYAQHILDQAKNSGSENVYIDAKELFGVLGKLNMSEEQFRQMFPESITTDIKTIREAGGDVVIPTEHFLSRLKRTDLLESLKVHMRFDRNDSSMFEAEAMRAQEKLLRQDAEKQVALEDESETQFQTELTELYENLVTVAQQSGTVTDRKARAVASLYRSWVNVNARKANLMPKEFQQKYGIKIGMMPAAEQRPVGEEFAQAVDTPQFKAWFGESKVVDEQGQPLVVYHGTGRSFQAFDRSKLQRVGFGHGFHFAASPELANKYAAQWETESLQKTGAAPQVMPVYLAIKNPAPYSVYSEVRNKQDSGNRFADEVATRIELQDLGYDGIVYDDYVGPEGARKAYVAFNPTQIKSVNNRGTFDVTNADLLEQPVVGEEGVGGVLRGEFSTRQPGGKKPVDNPFLKVLGMDLETVEKDKSALQKNADTIATYPFLRLSAKDKKSPMAVGEKLIQHVTDNLLWLHDNMPPDVRTRAKLWYDGGRRYVDFWADRYSLTPQQTAAVIALYSPQRDWFVNMSMAERTLDIMATQRDAVWNDQMTSAWKEIAESSSVLQDENVTINDFVGKSLNDLIVENNHLKIAVFVRVFDKVYNSNKVAILTPEGGSTGRMARTMQWSGYKTIAKGVSVILDGSFANISTQLGDEHKVRNFYNNLFSPNSPLGHVTIDTHAVAAAYLLPVSSKHLYVSHAWGGKGGATSRATGLNGLYPFLLEAYRRAAQQRDILPREMQSITWEVIRTLFEAKQKANETLTKSVDKIWSRYGKRRITLDEARKQLVSLYDGFGEIPWEKDQYSNNLGTTYTGDSRDAMDKLKVAQLAAQPAGAGIAVEVAPNPNDTQLTAEWDKFSLADKYSISKSVIDEVLPLVLKEFGVSGKLNSQLGGYLGKTNPSFAITIDRSELASAVASMLGDVLGQDGMYIASDVPFYGGEKGSSVSIKLPAGYTPTQIDDLYTTLYTLTHNGKPIATGHSTVNGYMVIGNNPDVGIDVSAMANMIASVLDESFEVQTLDSYSRYLSRGKDYASQDLATRIPPPAGSPLETRRDDLLRRTTEILRRNINAAKSAAATAAATPTAAAAGTDEFLQPVDGDGAAGVAPEGEPKRKAGRASYRKSDFTLFLRGEGNVGEKSDFSSWLHEFSHHFLNISMLMAAEPDAHPDILKDAETLLNWFGIDPEIPLEKRIAKWNSMSVDEQRPHHEAWAYNWEIWTYNGTAPSSDLRTLFERFRVWMIDIYTDIVNTMNRAYRKEFGRDLPALTPEVRGVMERMIAADRAIQHASKVRMAIASLVTFEQAKLFGFSQEEWDGYQKLDAQQKQAMIETLMNRSFKEMQWLSNASTRHLKDLQRLHDDLRKKVRAEVAEQVENEPVYLLRNWFSTGRVTVERPETMEMGVGETIEVESRPRFQEDMVRPYFPVTDEAWATMSSTVGAIGGQPLAPLMAKKGLDPIVVKGMFDFKTVQQMFAALMTAAPLDEEINARTDARMLAEYGDLQDPKAQNAIISEALHNDARTRFVAQELAFMTKVTEPVRVFITAAREVARSIIGNKRVRDALRVYDHELAETRSAKRVIDAIKNGDKDGAITAKRQQLVQHELTKQSAKVREEIETRIDSFKKVFKQDATLAKRRNMALVNAARAILSYYGLGQPNVPAEIHAEQALQMDAKLYADVLPLIDAAKRNAKDYRDMTVTEFRVMRETIEEIWHNSRQENIVRLNDKLMELAKMENELLKDLNEKKIPAVLPGETRARTAWETRMQSVLKLRALGVRVETWCEIMGPSFTQYLWRPVKDALNEYRSVRNDKIGRLEKMFIDLGKNAEKGTIDAIDAVGYEFGEGNGGYGILELIGALLHMGNESNRKKFFLGRVVKRGKREGQTWGTRNEDGSIDTTAWDNLILSLIKSGKLRKEHMDFVQGVWDLLEDMKPTLQRAHYEMFGHNFKPVEAKPFKVTFADGVEVEYRGGYFPAKTDKLLDYKASERGEVQEAMADFKYAMPATESGFMEERVDVNRPLSFDLNIMIKHVDDVVKFAMVQPTLSGVLKLINRDGFRKTLNRYDPSAYNEILLPWLNRAVQQSTSKKGSNEIIDGMLDFLRNNAATAIMFGSVSNTLQNVTGFLVAATKISPLRLAKSLIDFLFSRRSDGSLSSRCCKMSKWLDNRLKNQIFDMRQTIGDVIVKPSMYQKIDRWVKKHTYFMQRGLQNIMDVVVWDAAFNQYMEENGKSSSDTKAVADAIAAADSAVRKTQNSYDAEDLAQYEISTPLAKTLTQFSGYFNMLANLNAENFQKLHKRFGLRMFLRPETYMMYMLGFGLPMFIGDAIARAMAGNLSEDDDDDDSFSVDAFQFFLGSQLRGMTAMIPGIGPNIQATLNMFNDKTYDDRMLSGPAVTYLERLGRGARRGYEYFASEEELNGYGIRDLMTLLSVPLPGGAALPAVSRPLFYLQDLATGDGEATGSLDYLRGLLSGKVSTEGKQ